MQANNVYHPGTSFALDGHEMGDNVRKCDFCEQDAVLDDRGAWFCELCYQGPRPRQSDNVVYKEVP